MAETKKNEGNCKPPREPAEGSIPFHHFWPREGTDEFLPEKGVKTWCEGLARGHREAKKDSKVDKSRKRQGSRVRATS